MNEIIALNQNIRSAYGDRFADEGLTVERTAGDPAITGFPDPLLIELEAVRLLISRYVPPEFGFQVRLGDEEPSLAITYEDGPAAEFRTGISLAQWLSVADQLRDFDWDCIRKMALSGAAVFNEIVEHSNEGPENIPSTKGLQKKFREQTDAFLKAAQTDRTKVHALVVIDYFGVLEHENFEDLKSFTYELPNLMTCAHHVIAVVVEGRVVSAAEIDRMKRAALDELKDMPISYAQASGRRFPPTVLDD